MPSMTYECLFPGVWSDGSLAPCEPKSCKAPPEVKYAEKNSSDRVFPAWIEYKCTHGYHYEHDNTSAKVAWCSPDQEWTDVPEDCSPVECGQFPPVGNATVSSVYKNRYRDTVVWTCIPGFMFPDRAVRQWVGCRENYVNWQIGRWNLSKLPDCIPLFCLEPPNPANTTRSSIATAYRSIISYRCVSDRYEFPSGDEELFTQCNMDALWRPSVPHCRNKPPKLKMKGKKYEPPPMESPEAKTVGTVAVAIMVILLVLTILIDIGSWYQGFQFLRYNLRTFCRYYGFLEPDQAASDAAPSQPTGPICYTPHPSVHPLNTQALSDIDLSY
ncbi:sushi, von Willebrand factor type A, EGF and pentraxin domain-containing protein 1-like [Lineus longissimus]|uniref:sushi, von Willebrand factor type A, EGF and pentraxin domain-containing protein 1-like n=1 Tax=Lineus longissimus TaxID=88925 RepID=UPI00315CEFED